jgi:hypothetical protein
MGSSEGELAAKRAYEDNTIRGKRGGRFTIQCKKGLWGVEAPNEQEAEREAKYYFFQYYRDGEYG